MLAAGFFFPPFHHWYPCATWWPLFTTAIIFSKAAQNNKRSSSHTLSASQVSEDGLSGWSLLEALAHPHCEGLTHQKAWMGLEESPQPLGQRRQLLPGGSTVKYPPAVQETQVQSLGWGDPLDRGSWQATVHGVAKTRIRLNTAHTHLSSSLYGPPQSFLRTCIWLSLRASGPEVGDRWASSQLSSGVKLKLCSHTDFQGQS